MPSSIYRAQLIASIRTCLAKGEAAKGESHAGMKGTGREDAIKKLLEDVMPHGVQVTSGKVVDIHGNESHQSDIIIHCPRLVVPMMQGTVGYVPADSCLFVMEVKSTLSTEEWDDIIRKAQRLRTLRYSCNEQPARSVIPAQMLVFAFGTNIAPNHQKEFRRYLDRDSGAYTTPLVSAFCVAGQGFSNFVYRTDDQGSPHEILWHSRGENQDNDSIVDFLAIFVNSLHAISQSRGFPNLGSYVVNPRAFTVFHANGGTHEEDPCARIPPTSG